MEETEEMSLNEILDKYGTLPEDCLREIGQNVLLEQFHRKKTIVRQGTLCGRLYFTAAGITRVAFRRGDKEDTVCFGDVGDVFVSFHSLYGAQPARFSLAAVTDVVCYSLPLEVFNALRAKHPELESWWARLLTEQLYSFEELYSRWALTTPEERLQRFWERKPPSLRRIPAPQLTRIVPLKIIAQYLGIAAPTLSRIRRSLVGK